MSEPLPESGWSREVVSVKQAIVVPPAAMIGRPQCGVVSADGDCAHAATWRGGIRMTRPVHALPEPRHVLKGRHVWGGLYYGHFGHFMTETMSRCWAFDAPDAESVVFVPKHGDLQEFQKYQSEFWEMLNLKQRVTIAREPILVEELLVPGQGFGLGAISRGTPEFRATMRNMAERLPRDPEKKIYISRTKFNGRGGVVAEVAIERSLRENGYEIVHPEKLALSDQLRLYKSATHILGVDSSAFHIVGMVADASKKIGFILRRSNGAHESIMAQISAMTGKDPVIVDAILAHWMDLRQTESNHLSWGELDHSILAQALKDHGFIDATATWLPPTDAEILQSVHVVGDRAKTAVCRHPMVGP